MDEEGIYKVRMKDRENRGLEKEWWSGVRLLGAGWEGRGDGKK